jgi:hypothetical protein
MERGSESRVINIHEKIKNDTREGSENVISQTDNSEKGCCFGKGPLAYGPLEAIYLTAFS